MTQASAEITGPCEFIVVDSQSTLGPAPHTAAVFTLSIEADVASGTAEGRTIQLQR